MTPQVMRILKKLYHFDNSCSNERGETCYSEDILSEKERALLHAHGWIVNDNVRFTGHDEVITKLRSLKDNPALTKKRCLDAFVAGLGGSWPRGWSVWPAWQYLEHCPAHSYEEKPDYACCWVCGGHDQPEVINDSEFQYCLYFGNAYCSRPMYAYLNLRHLAGIAAVQPTKDDIIALSALLDLIREAPDDETPGGFEKRLAASKILRGDKYTRRGVLNSLALAGVIPNRFIPLSNEHWTDYGDITICEKQLSNTKGRSDMEMPWAGWTGSLKLNEERALILFDDYWSVLMG